MPDTIQEKVPASSTSVHLWICYRKHTNAALFSTLQLQDQMQRQRKRLQSLRPAARLVLVRHGETDWNVSKRLQGQWTGHPAPSLTERGCAQATQLATYLAAIYPEAERIVSSDLLRAKQVFIPGTRLHDIPRQPQFL